MMSTVGDKSEQLSVDKQRCDHGDVRQVSTAEEGIVNHHHVAVSPAQTTDDIAHGIGHTAEVNRNMRRLGTELAPGIEDRAGEIETVLDVGREGGAAQHRPHLLADRLDTAGK